MTAKAGSKKHNWKRIIARDTGAILYWCPKCQTWKDKGEPSGACPGKRNPNLRWHVNRDTELREQRNHYFHDTSPSGNEAWKGLNERVIENAYAINASKMGKNPRELHLRQPGDSGWHYGDRVKVKPEGGMSEFRNVTGTVIGAEGEYLRIEFDSPVHVKGMDPVRDDIFMPYTVKKIRGNPGTKWHYDRAGKFEDKIDDKTLPKKIRDNYRSLLASEYIALDESRKHGIPNPGAAWHTKQIDKIDKRPRTLLNSGRIDAHTKSLRVSRRIGLPNPSTKTTLKFLIPLGLILSIWWYKNRQQ
jgi:hypothetical protein